MIGVVDVQVFYGNLFRHISGVTEIMLAGIGPPNQVGAGGSATCRNKNAVALRLFKTIGRSQEIPVKVTKKSEKIRLIIGFIILVFTFSVTD